MAESNGRVYDPAIARFLSPDPLLQAPNHWLSYNRYAYCMNNPMLYTDPSGMSWFSDLWDWAKGNPLINPIAGLDWLNENIAPSVNNFLDNNNISVNAGGGYNSGNGFYTYGGNQIFYHNQQANSTEAILGRTTVTFDNGIDQRGVNFVNNLGVSMDNVRIFPENEIPFGIGLNDLVEIQLDYAYVVVEKGNTVYGIANRKFKGETSVEKIIDKNSFIKYGPDSKGNIVPLIYPGQKILIPRSTKLTWREYQAYQAKLGKPIRPIPAALKNPLNTFYLVQPFIDKLLKSPLGPIFHYNNPYEYRIQHYN